MRRLFTIVLTVLMLGALAVPQAVGQEEAVPKSTIHLFDQVLTAYSPDSIPYPTVPPAVWASTTFTVTLELGDRAILSSTPDGKCGYASDDWSYYLNGQEYLFGHAGVLDSPQFIIGESVTNYFGRHAPLDVTSYVAPGGAGSHQVTWELGDYGGLYGTTALYLVVFGADGELGPCTDGEVLTQDLGTLVGTINLENGISNALDAKLSNVVKALEDVNENNDGAAINKLEAFINEVEAQAGKKIAVEDAEALIAAAQQIIDLLTN